MQTFDIRRPATVDKGGRAMNCGPTPFAILMMPGTDAAARFIAPGQIWRVPQIWHKCSRSIYRTRINAALMWPRDLSRPATYGGCCRYGTDVAARLIAPEHLWVEDAAGDLRAAKAPELETIRQAR